MHSPVPDSPFGPFFLLDKIASGPRGVVFRAQQSSSLVALKVYARLPAGDRARRGLEAFLTHQGLNSAVAHPGLVPVISAGVEAGHPYVAMELCQGPTLAPRLRPGSRPALETCLHWGLVLAEGLAQAHARGVLHLHLKPTNVLFQGKAPRITDFGMFHLDGLLERPSAAPSSLQAWRAPEQRAGLGAGEAADQYSLGLLLLALLQGGLPGMTPLGRSLLGAGEGTAENSRALHGILDGIPSGERLLPGLPLELEGLCRVALSTDPSERFPSVQAMADAMRELLPSLEAPTLRTLGRSTLAGSPWQTRETSSRTYSPPTATDTLELLGALEASEQELDSTTSDEQLVPPPAVSSRPVPSLPPDGGEDEGSLRPPTRRRDPQTRTEETSLQIPSNPESGLQALVPVERLPLPPMPPGQAVAEKYQEVPSGVSSGTVGLLSGLVSTRASWPTTQRFSSGQPLPRDPELEALFTHNERGTPPKRNLTLGNPADALGQEGTAPRPSRRRTVVLALLGVGAAYLLLVLFPPTPDEGQNAPSPGAEGSGGAQEAASRPFAVPLIPSEPDSNGASGSAPADGVDGISRIGQPSAEASPPAATAAPVVEGQRAVKESGLTRAGAVER